MSSEPNAPQTFHIRIPFLTVLTIFVSIIVFYVLRILAPLFMTLFIGILLAVSLFPIIRWLESKKIPKYLAVLLLTVVMTACIIVIFITILPILMQQVSEFINDIPKLRNGLLDYFSANSFMKPIVEKTVTKDTMMLRGNFAEIFAAGNLVLGSIFKVVLMLVFAIYLLMDGARTMEWIKAFFPLHIQQKISKTTQEVSRVIFSYVTGQFITSTLSFLYVFVALWALGVPNKLLLAFLAGIFDVLPVLGFFLAVIPAALFALTVSGETALIVIGLYILYHAIENYLIIPAIYGKRLRVSTFVVLLSLLAAGMVAGVEGAIVILPIVASYPIIEKIWLKRVVGPDTVAEHSKK